MMLTALIMLINDYLLQRVYSTRYLTLFVFFPISITPHFFQLIKFSRLGLHHMHHDIHIIDQHPMQLLVPFMMIRGFAAFFFYLVHYIIRDRPYLRLAACFANNKKIGDSFFYFSQVKREYMLSLFFLYRSDNGFDDF